MDDHYVTRVGRTVVVECAIEEEGMATTQGAVIKGACTCSFELKQRP